MWTGIAWLLRQINSKVSVPPYVKDNYSVKCSIVSNNGNVICIGARVISIELAKKILGEWITLEFKNGRSTPKVQEIIDIEKENLK